MSYTKEHIKKAIDDKVIVGNGHAIIAPEHYEGFEVGHLVKKHFSNFDAGKSTIYTDGEPVEDCDGVYNLDFLYDLCSQLDLKTQNFIGRGFQAQECFRKLEKWADSEEEAHVS